ncbi:hypothetical protein J6590_096770 [Homalodisca vitripennis]|nr:hypothetical protein J6590_096770 [Homalodisca vitripennis]
MFTGPQKIGVSINWDLLPMRRSSLQTSHRRQQKSLPNRLNSTRSGTPFGLPQTVWEQSLIVLIESVSLHTWNKKDEIKR